MLEPVGDRIIVKRFVPEEKVGSLFVPEQSQDKPLYGVVLAVGPDISYVYSGPDPSKVFIIGDILLFGKYAGMEVEYGGEKFLIIKEEEVIAIVRN